MKRAVYPLILAIGLFTSYCQAETPITFAGVLAEKIQQQDKQGYLDKIYQEIARRTSLTINYDVMPMARTMSLFDHKKVDCILPGSSNRYFDRTKQHDIVRSQAISALLLFKFTFERNQALLAAQDLADVNIGYVRNIKMFNALNMPPFDNATHIVASHHRHLFDMLHFGRTELIVGWYPVVNMLATARNSERVSFDAEHVLSTDYLVVSCHRSDKTEAFIETINKAINSMWQDGTMVAMHPNGTHHLKALFPPPAI